jgi:hypothetical protein
VDREYRRHLAVKHQQRQLRLKREITAKVPYDSERKVQSHRGQRARFVAYLKGNVYEPREVGLWNTDPPDIKWLGRLKKLSWTDHKCRCRWCSPQNPRKSGNYKYKGTVTYRERIGDMMLDEELEIYKSENS